MAYQVDVTSKARKQFNDLPSAVKPHIAEAISGLSGDPRPHACQKLADMDGYRLRCGDYRILYVVDDKAKLVTVYRVKHRRDAYRGN
jgi:mRNA interferase RelE/StbE